MGIGPTRLAWKARALPLSYTRILLLVGATGFEPTTPCSQGRCSTKLSYAPNNLLLCEEAIKIWEGKHYLGLKI